MSGHIALVDPEGHSNHRLQPDAGRVKRWSAGV